jgi:hypothetical protein
MSPAMKYARITLAVLILVATALPQANQQSCLIVRKEDRQTMPNPFPFGPAGLIVTAAAKYSTVDSFNLSNAKSTYWGSDLQKLTQENVHVIVVDQQPQFQEVENARSSCRGEAPRHTAERYRRLVEANES